MLVVAVFVVAVVVVVVVVLTSIHSPRQPEIYCIERHQNPKKNVTFDAAILTLGVVHILRNHGWGEGVSPNDYSIT